MNVLVDTSVWSLALRKRPKTDEEKQIVSNLSEFIREMRVIMMGPIRQELLSGISDERKFEALKEKLRAFEDEELRTEHFELAAAFSNRCRQAGVQGSHTDFLICAFSTLNNCGIFTLDKDFDLYAKHLKIRLHSRVGT
jgi:predicted nucleic acid-binding protein